MQNTDLTAHFLIAMPAMTDPYFSRTLTYICEHGEQGALGVVVNKPIDLSLQGLFEQIGMDLHQQPYADLPVYFGGPVQTNQGFVLHQPIGEWQSTLNVAGEVGLTSSKDILEATRDGRGPGKILVSLGYAGWSPGQLEHEIQLNGWLTVKAQPNIIFDLRAEERLPAAMQLLGIDFANLSDQAGHA
ncbi:MAG: YqgE/AlgH family protein [Burkholderiales bacterium]